MKDSHTKSFLKKEIIHNIRRMVTLSLIGLILIISSSSFGSLYQEAQAAKGLRVIVHGGQGNVCVKSVSEDLGCQSLNGETAEFDFSPGVVAVGESFTVCDNNGCINHENSPEKAPEHVYLSGSGTGQGLPAQSSSSQAGTGTYQQGYSRGYKDGLDHPFDQSVFNNGKGNEYVKGYEAGFMKGCLAVEGNDKDTCNSAMDK
jgi:hypothetical protein